MSKVYRKNRETRRYELKHRVTLVEIAVITLILALICQLAVIGLAAASGGWTGILAKLVKVETLKAVGTALESVRNGLLFMTILIGMFSTIRFVLKVRKVGNLSNYLTTRKLKKSCYESFSRYLIREHDERTSRNRSTRRRSDDER